MLGTRTKQVFSYGRRTQRIVSDDREPRSTTTSGGSSIFDDIPTSTWARAPVVSKMKKRQPVKAVAVSKMSSEESESSPSSSSSSEADSESPSRSPSPPVKLRIQRRPRPKPKPKRLSNSGSPSISPIAIAVPSKRVLVPKPKPKPKAGQRTRVSKLIQEDRSNPSTSLSPNSKPKPTSKDRPTKRPTSSTLTVPETPPRRPLSAFSLNVPVPVSSHTSPAVAVAIVPSKNTPAVAVPSKKPTVNTKTRAGGVRGIGKPLPLPRTPSFSPFVDVDIIVLDESGRKVSQERRVSRARDVGSIPIDLGRGTKTGVTGTHRQTTRTKTKTKGTAPAGGSIANAIVLDTDTDEDVDEDEEEEVQIQPKPSNRLGLTRRAKVIRVDTSDDDDDDEGDEREVEVIGEEREEEGAGEDVEVVPTPNRQPSNPPRQRNRHIQVEVVVPPVPPSYGVKHQPKAVPPAVPIPQSRAQPQPTFLPPLPLPNPHHLLNPNPNHLLTTRYQYQHFDSPIAPRRQIQLTPIRAHSQSNPHSYSQFHAGQSRSRLFPSASRDTPATPGNLDDGDEDDCSLSLEELEMELELENLNLGLASPSSSSSSSSSPSPYSLSSSSHQPDPGPHPHQRQHPQAHQQPRSNPRAPQHPRTRERTSQPPHLLPLLTECHQETCGPHEFSAFIETFPFDPIVQPAASGSGTDSETEGGGESNSETEGGGESGGSGGKGGSRTRTGVRFKKIGEASYSEVFGIGDVVLKVIPLRDEEAGVGLRSSLGAGGEPRMHRAHNYNDHHHHEPDTNHETDGPAPSDAADVLKEIIVTRAMGDLCGCGDEGGGGGGFVKLLRAYIVRGRYPEVLLELWDEYFERKGSESVRPDTFNVSQVYAIIVLPNGGPDLEAYTFSGSATKTKTQTTTKTNANAKTSHGWRQACSLFWQVTKALAHAEQLVSFEHRDLHWGQILVKNTPIENNTIPPQALKTQNQNQQSRPRVPKRKMMMDDPGHGIKATLIDLGLSRMDAGDGRGGEVVHWTPFDEEVFMGEGDYQFDVYRMMREHNGGRWEEFKPFTNVMWLHYLAVKLLHYKRLKPPPVPKKTTNANSNANATTVSASSYTEKECYECLLEIEGILGKEIAAKVRPPPAAAAKGKGGRRKAVPVHASEAIGLSCAGDVVGYGFKKGWVAPIS